MLSMMILRSQNRRIDVVKRSMHGSKKHMLLKSCTNTMCMCTFYFSMIMS